MNNNEQDKKGHVEVKHLFVWNGETLRLDANRMKAYEQLPDYVLDNEAFNRYDGAVDDYLNQLLNEIQKRDEEITHLRQLASTREQQLGLRGIFDAQGQD